MELLYSKIKPCEYDNSSFSEAFESGIVNSDSIKIATGYVTEDSLLELKSILLFYNEENKDKMCSLVIGMHGREGFTRAQYEAAIDLAEFLKEKGIGSVRVCTAFKFHGKTYVFWKNGKPAAPNKEISQRLRMQFTPNSYIPVLGLVGMSFVIAEMKQEAERIYSEGISNSKEMIDLALILGGGILPNRRGLLNE